MNSSAINSQLDGEEITPIPTSEVRETQKPSRTALERCMALIAAVENLSPQDLDIIRGETSDSTNKVLRQLDSEERPSEVAEKLGWRRTPVRVGVPAKRLAIK